jgi:hypothetical protein
MYDCLIHIVNVRDDVPRLPFLSSLLVTAT